jgi:hypothetical protein
MDTEFIKHDLDLLPCGRLSPTSDGAFDAARETCDGSLSGVFPVAVVQKSHYTFIPSQSLLAAPSVRWRRVTRIYLGLSGSGVFAAQNASQNHRDGCGESGSASTD